LELITDSLSFYEKTEEKLVNPFTALIVFLIVAVLLAFIFFPRWGLWSLWKKAISDKKKILIEDSLKCIYDLAVKNKPCTIESLSGSMNLSINKLEELTHLLLKLNLIKLGDNIISLTEGGKSYAVKIVRIHRLLEKYLAEETSIKEDYWHLVAEDKEHSVSFEEAESISARLGNPLTDPHGDPIPDISGGHLQPESKPLNEMEGGKKGVIIHIEDEPPEIYSKILQFNLNPGSGIKILNALKEGIEIESGGRKIILPPELSENIFIAELETEEDYAGLKKLSELKEDEEAYIAGISKAMRGGQRRRLLDFGFVPGTKITVRLRSLGNDPVAYEIRNTTVALRRKQAELVFVREGGTNA